MTAVDVRDLFRVHSTPEGDAAALQGLTVSIDEREFVAIVGPSGAGKSSLLRILAGGDRPSAGAVRVFGWDLPRLSGRALRRYRAEVVGYVDQHPAVALDPTQPINDSVSTRLRLEGANDADRRAHELLEAVGLGDRRDALPSQLSGGEQQRAAVCAAIAHRPQLLLADEPTGELGRTDADNVFALLSELPRRHGATVVVVTHDQRVGDYADRVVRIRDGRVSEERRGAGERIVVGRGGWLRLPEELLRSAHVGTLVEAQLEDERIVITAADGDRRPVEVGAAQAPRPVQPRRRILELRDIRKSYGRRTVLGGLSVDIDRGALTVVTGPSGSGKTTLLDLLIGLEQPDAGEIAFDGVDVSALDRDSWAGLRANRVGYVPQQPILAPFLSARENVELMLRLRGRDGDAVDALAAVGLTDRVEQLVGRLSGGERLRVAAARGFASSPDVLVADEPTSRLDEANAHAIATMLARLAGDRGAAVIVASHDPAVIEHADKVIALG